IEVDLSASFEHWSEPRSSASTVLRRQSGAANPDGSAVALFDALADSGGTPPSIDAAQSPPACASSPRPCPFAMPRKFHVTIVVTG
ncbi:MAG: hypothetical protein ACREQ5_24595, partial [Candidatus Dormibacteria bacterium]